MLSVLSFRSDSLEFMYEAAPAHKNTRELNLNDPLNDAGPSSIQMSLKDKIEGRKAKDVTKIRPREPDI